MEGVSASDRPQADALDSAAKDDALPELTFIQFARRIRAERIDRLAWRFGGA
jgi:hypothetical protein